MKSYHIPDRGMAEVVGQVPIVPQHLRRVSVPGLAESPQPAQLNINLGRRPQYFHDRYGDWIGLPSDITAGIAAVGWFTPPVYPAPQVKSAPRPLSGGYAVPLNPDPRYLF